MDFRVFSREIAKAVLIAAALGMAACASSPRLASEPKEAESNRPILEDRLEKAILGALVWLSENQVQDRSGRGSPDWDSTEVGDGARDTQKISLPLNVSLEIPTPKDFSVRNRLGEWGSEIHLLPNRRWLRGRGVLETLDHNLFSTAHVLAPCYLIDDSALPAGDRFVTRMRSTGLESLRDYRRGTGWNFWTVLPGVEGEVDRTGPLNVPVPLLRTAAEVYLSQPDYAAFREQLRRHDITRREIGMSPRVAWTILRWQLGGRDSLPPRDWLERCLRSNDNPIGADALFSIPNDSDDAAAMVVLATVAWQHGEGLAPDLDLLRFATGFRDLDREREDARDGWKGKNSGAYLTWMTDENRGVFSQLAKGVIPLEVNNVDAVVNANMVNAISRCGLTDLPGYGDALSLVAQCAREGHWPEAGLYYPQRMAFPYAATRAWREGGARSAEMDTAMGCLLRDLLDLQESHARSHPLRAGAFPGGEDPTEALSTAMGLNALLNLGEATAGAIGEENRYRRAIGLSTERLLALAKIDRTGPRSHRSDLEFPKPMSWESGLFFGSSFWDLSHWRSEAVSTALAMEALAKVAMAFEKNGSGDGVTKKTIALRKTVDGQLSLRVVESP